VVAATAMGGLSLVGAFARRIAGPYGRGRLAGEAMRMHLGGGAADAQRALEALREEVEHLDFTERMLAQSRAKPALPGGPS
jgi:hypothetical protein